MPQHMPVLIERPDTVTAAGRERERERETYGKEEPSWIFQRYRKIERGKLRRGIRWIAMMEKGKSEREREGRRPREAFETVMGVVYSVTLMQGQLVHLTCGLSPS